MIELTNNVKALSLGLHSHKLWSAVVPDIPAQDSELFYCKMPVQLAPILSIPQRLIEGLQSKVKCLTEFNRTTTAKPIKEPFKQHLLKPYAFESIGRFCLIPKEAS